MFSLMKSLFLLAGICGVLLVVGYGLDGKWASLLQSTRESLQGLAQKAVVKTPAPVPENGTEKESAAAGPETVAPAQGQTQSVAAAEKPLQPQPPAPQSYYPPADLPWVAVPTETVIAEEPAGVIENPLVETVAVLPVPARKSALLAGLAEDPEAGKWEAEVSALGERTQRAIEDINAMLNR